MWAEIRSEIRKLITTRSTYGVLAFALVLEGLFAFWANGVKVDPRALQSPAFLQGQIVESISALGLIGALVGVLVITHEYRYGTIMYTLTASNRRSKVMLAKFLVTSLYALLFTTAMALLTLLFVKVGVAIQGVDMVPQTFAYGDFVWRIVLYGWSFSVIALVIGFIARNQLVAFSALLLLPGLVEQLLGVLLKQNRIYLPFNALDAVIHPGSGPHVLSSAAGAGVVGCYLLIAWVVAALLFQKRDAN